MFCADTVTEPALPEPTLEAVIPLMKGSDPVESITISPVALTLTALPLPQPVAAVHSDREPMTEPASSRMLWADTVTVPAFPEPKLDALIALGKPGGALVESTMSCPVAVTVTLPPGPLPKLRDPTPDPPSNVMFPPDTFTDPAGAPSLAL